MSRAKWASSRGFSIVAAVVFAAILTVTAIAIQLTVPTSVPTESQGAAVASGVTGGAAPITVPPGCQSINTQSFFCPDGKAVDVKCQAGQDYAVERFNQKDSSNQDVRGWLVTVIQVCKAKVTPSSVSKWTNTSSEGPVAKEIPRCDAGNKIDSTDLPSCRYDYNSGELYTTTAYNAWKCTTRIYDESISDNQADAKNNRRCNISTSSVGNAGTTPAAGTPAKPVSAYEPVSPDPDSGCYGYPNWTAASGPCPTTPIKDSRDIDQLLANQEENKNTLNDYCGLPNVDAATDERCVNTKQNIAATETRLKELANENQQIVNTTCAGGDNYAACEQAKKEASENVTKINDGIKDSQAGPSAQTNVPGCSDGDFSKCDLGAKCSINGKAGTWQTIPGGESCVGPGIDNGSQRTQGPPQQQGGQARFPGGSQQGGTQFTSPGMGQGNNGAPASPFGGQCTSGYVCQGNTLYWQTPSNGGGLGATSCMTQPYQQCQFGCQPPVGAVQPGQQQTTAGTIQQWLPVISSVMSLFGGNNNNSMANPNLSRSCATQPQQQQSPYGTGTNGQPCYQPPQQPPQSQCTTGTWQPISGSQNGCTTGWQCVPNNGNGTNGGAPTAQLSCQPKVADIGMQIGFSWSCGNSTGSAGTGFETGGQLSGNTTAVAPAPPAGSNNTATYTLTCINQGVTSSAQCQVQLGKPGIVLVTNPKQVKSGESALVGWITAGMQSCVVSSPDQADFTQKNAGSTNVNGGVTSSPITKDTTFKLDCQTVGGQTKSASATVTIN